ncbi:MAG: ATP synthase F1 subunit delta, partial [Dongiaceae bacterium]
MAARGSGPGGLAARYATALFELADDKQQLDEVATDLTALKAMIAGSDDLRRLLRSPALTRDEQGRAMAAVLEKAGLCDLVRRFVGLVADNRRLFALGPMIDAYLARLAARRGEVTAEVTAAKPLSD